jgi:tetratricopeptide (TPR) repeat protein
MKMTFTVSKLIGLTLICAALLSYGSTTQGQRRGRNVQKPASRAASLVDEAAKLADDRKYAEAIEIYKLAIQRDPDYAAAHGGLGDVYFDSGKWEQALAEYKEQIRLAPNDAQAYFDLGYLYNFMGRHGEAFAPLVKATALDPSFGEAFYEIGYAYLRGEHFEKSVPFFRSAIRLIPDYSEAYYGLGLVYARLGKKDIAGEQLQKLTSLDPKLLASWKRRLEDHSKLQRQSEQHPNPLRRKARLQRSTLCQWP